ncbi:hypothetical protein [Pedobacter metabolipauper]|uniref:Lipoprotein n=1 Tax=Pedobacter metabolipauper TaxID=425513 RepID=A0A4R6SRC5_9SPHI|nr:hypothetical protein [Pedobacter metabolipauper]TDQ06190.1 hypothetical protein ATK78_4571 [Pedobacter metabolipauper]
MKKFYPLLLGSLLLLGACKFPNSIKSSEPNDSLQTRIDSAEISNDISEAPADKAVYSKIIKIDYQENQSILNILPLLPDSSMASWGWKKEEREGMVRSLATSNQFTDTTENYNTIRKVTPHYFETQVVDGVWTASLYKVSENHYIVITNDMVGDGSDVNAFEVKGKQITALSMDHLIGADPGNLLLKNSNEACKSLLDDYGMFTYDFSDPNLISISSSYFTKKANAECFNGNEITFKFNPKIKRFDLVKTSWGKP